MRARLVGSGFLTLATVVTCILGSSARADWSLQKTFTWRPEFRNIYYTAFPGCVGLGDVAAPGSSNNRCTQTDGLVDATDAVCTFYSNRIMNTSFTLSYLDTQACYFKTIKVDYSPVLGISFMGTAAPIDPSRGYLVNMGARPGTAQFVEGGLLAGPCQPRMQPRTISARDCTADLIPNPPDSRLRSADEILCGERNVDWRDDNADGKPDTCPNGLFDGVHRLQVSTYDNDPTTHPETDKLFVTRQLEWNPMLGLIFLGTDFSVPPGDAVFLRMTPAQMPRVWDPPVDPLACP